MEGLALACVSGKAGRDYAHTVGAVDRGSEQERYETRSKLRTPVAAMLLCSVHQLENLRRCPRRMPYPHCLCLRCSIVVRVSMSWLLTGSGPVQICELFTSVVIEKASQQVFGRLVKNNVDRQWRRLLHAKIAD